MESTRDGNAHTAAESLYEDLFHELEGSDLPAQAPPLGQGRTTYVTDMATYTPEGASDVNVDYGIDWS